jgi:spore coat polysaccharide biosynthesis protein SpsF
MPSKPEIAAILQARVSSTRLPGKVLKPILGVPMILRQIERVRRAKKIDQFIVATSNDRTDDPLADICSNTNIECFRGSLEDVLDRFYHAAKPLNPEHIVRLTGDCPLADPQLIDQLILFHLQGGYDYSSNTVETTYPDGLDVEIFRFSCLELAWKEAILHLNEGMLCTIHQ